VEETKSALITGATGGIGQALVSVFHEAGYSVIATDICSQPKGIVCDHYLEADLQRLVQEDAYAQTFAEDVRTALNGHSLDALINNAAVQHLGGGKDLQRTQWQQTLDINLLAPFLLIQLLLPELEAARGTVINIGSIHARLTKRNFVAYATSKAALAGLTRALAVDLGHRVRINAIEPAAIETPMLKAGFANEPQLYRRLAACHPQGRVGAPEEVAQLALAIAGPHVRFLNGATIGIDGGISARLFDPD
jgi:NAD(P)-dependent dehydrogenase (short-subunit alcohol dehydrogenase family)